MSKKIANFFLLFLYMIFFFYVSKFYFSEENILLTNKSRSNYNINSSSNFDNLPTLENDTNNIIIYKNDINEFKKKRKKRFWEKLINDEE